MALTQWSLSIVAAEGQARLDRLVYKKESEYEERRTQDTAMERHEIDWQDVQRTVANGASNQNAPLISYDSMEGDPAYQLSTDDWLSQTQFDSSRLGLSNVDRSIHFPPLLPPRSQCGADVEAEAEAMFDMSVRDDVTTLSMDDLCRRIRALEAQ